jgi:hypothetical protein
MLKLLRQYKRLSLIPVMFWLMLKFFMTGVFLPLQAFANVDSDGPEYFTVCTFDGLQYATWNDDGSFSYVSQDDVNSNESNPDQNAKHTTHCPLCVFPAASFLSRPDIDWAPHSILMTGLSWPPIPHVILDQPVKGFFLSRAPPLS